MYKTFSNVFRPIFVAAGVWGITRNSLAGLIKENYLCKMISDKQL